MKATQPVPPLTPTAGPAQERVLHAQTDHLQAKRERLRVNVIADFVDPAVALGDAYRVEARVVLWSGDDVLKVPVSALFRRAENWNVFVIDGSRARRRGVEIGHRAAFEVEIAKGLSAGQQVVRHPSNDVEDGRRARVAR